MTQDEKQPISSLQKACIIIGGICFVLASCFVTNYLGFYSEKASHYPASVYKPFLSGNMLWAVNAALGIVGGVLMDYKHPIISGISGLVVVLGITGFSFLYFFWREYIFTFEMLIALIIGAIPGIILNALLRDKYVYKV